MADMVDSEKLEKEMYGKWIDADPGAILSLTTVNLHVGGVGADAFKARRIKQVDENTAVLEVEHVVTGAVFHNTWTYIEEENNDGE